MTVQGERLNFVRCSGCGAPVSGSRYNTPETFRCSACKAGLRVEVFPTFFRSRQPGQAGEALMSEEEASCFYHGRKKAAALCAECGRFLCALCEVRIGGRSVCPECIEKGRADGSMEMLVTQRTLYDSMALSLSILPLLFFFVTPITAPIAIFIAIRFWNKPGSLLPRTKARYISAIVVASLQVAGWGIFLASKI